MRILYLHGLYSKPGGHKPTFLKALGHDVINPALPDDDMARSIAIAQRAFDDGAPEAVVGSSRGGAVALNVQTADVPLLLIAPAWRKWGQARSAKPGTVILHAEADAVIPIDDSRALVSAGGTMPPTVRLLVVGRDHNMIDDEALQALAGVLDEFARDLGRK